MNAIEPGSQQSTGFKRAARHGTFGMKWNAEMIVVQILYREANEPQSVRDLTDRIFGPSRSEAEKIQRAVESLIMQGIVEQAAEASIRPATYRITTPFYEYFSVPFESLESLLEITVKIKGYEVPIEKLIDFYKTTSTVVRNLPDITNFKVGPVPLEKEEAEELLKKLRELRLF
jgi:predicted transcriptional regulator